MIYTNFITPDYFRSLIDCDLEVQWIGDHMEKQFYNICSGEFETLNQMELISGEENWERTILDHKMLWLMIMVMQFLLVMIMGMGTILLLLHNLDTLQSSIHLEQTSGKKL